MLSDDDVRKAAEALWRAEQKRDWTDPVSNRYPNAHVDDAYRIGLAVRDLKLAAGRSVKVRKIGLTSKAMQPGDVILSGSFVKAIPFDAGDSITALFDELGEVTLRVAE